MKTLFINHHLLGEMGIRIAGLSFKALEGTGSFTSHLCRSDSDGHYYIDLNFSYYSDRTTCRIKEDILIEIVSKIHKRIPFAKIVFEDYYHLTGEELFNLIN